MLFECDFTVLKEMNSELADLPLRELAAEQAQHVELTFAELLDHGLGAGERPGNRQPVLSRPDQ